MDFSDNGSQCMGKCGIDGIYKGRNWCLTVSKNQNSWDFCTPHSKNVKTKARN